jgi:hypothetical protein
MNILVVTDSRYFRQQLAREVGRFAANTWANITLLGTLSASDKNQLDYSQQCLLNYRKEILNFLPVESDRTSIQKSILAWQKNGDRFTLISPDSWQKRLELVLIDGNIIQEIHFFSKRHALDLLVLDGYSNLNPLLLEAATEASGCVLVAKGATDPNQIVCCLSHEHISQNSLEMINQLTTLYNAALKFVGFSNRENERMHIEILLKQLLHYYNDLNLTPWLEMVDVSIMPQFIVQQSKKNLVAISVEKNSSCNGLFTQEGLMSLISNTPSSVLLLY